MICLIQISVSANAQFLGGNGDGFEHGVTGMTSLNRQGFYCLGGDGDGFSQVSAISTLNLQDFYCSGGDGDGNSMKYSPLATPNNQDIYCSGGDYDGFSSASFLSQLNVQDFYCSGGNGDGYQMQSSSIIAPNDASIYCSGGIGDGHDNDFITTTINIQDFYCLGGNNDGYNLGGLNTTINEQNFYCSGGNGDGFNTDGFTGYSYGIPLFCNGSDGDGFSLEKYNGSVFGSSLFCLGGNGDGYGQDSSVTTLFGIGIWKGLTNTDWNTNTNWTHQTIPSRANNITIPASCPNYPIVTQTMGIKFKLSAIGCQRLDIIAGASLSHTNRFYIYGEMRVEGNYISTSNIDYVFRIYSGGLVTIPSSGTVTLGNQSSGTGISDLLIYNGGIMNLQGGTLQMDDQLRVLSGGTFNMTDGELFVHKYGEGSAFSSSFTGNLVIESGALGGISGGILKICGKESVGDYHAFRVLDPTFDFTGTSSVIFQHGVSSTHYNAGIYGVGGVTFQNLTINKPGNTVFVLSNLEVENNLNIESGSTLELESGHQLTTGP